jgi:hypothetical protein
MGGTSACDSTTMCGSARENSRHKWGLSIGEHKSTGCAKSPLASTSANLEASRWAAEGSMASTVPRSVRLSAEAIVSSTAGASESTRSSPASF